MLDRGKLIKIMMLSTSDADGECLNAIRAANSMLSKLKMNWEEVLSNHEGTPTFDSLWKRSYDAKPPRTPRDSFGYTRQEWDAIIGRVDREVRGARDFIDSICDQWHETHRLTTRQKSAILKFYSNL